MALLSYSGLNHRIQYHLTSVWQKTLVRLALATLDAQCQHCRKQSAAWLCTACQQQWVNPVEVYNWPELDARVFALQPLDGLPKRRLYGAKFYHQSPWWCTALMAHGLLALNGDTSLPITLLTLPGRQGTHWMTRMARCLAMDAGYCHQTLAWVRPTQPQHTRPTAEDRWHNVQQAFRLDAVPQGQLLLVDDITTTGASLYHAATAIRQAGYTAPLQALTLCHTVKQ